jgi:hypothetical protein
MVTLARTPIIWRSTFASMRDFTLVNDWPPTDTGPTSGKFTLPSRPTTNRKVRFWLP